MHPVFAEDMREIVEGFLVETRELFEQLDHDLLVLESRPGDTALVDQVFRAVHTVKGTSGFLSLEQLSELAHHFEEVLNRLRRGELAMPDGGGDVMLRAFDLMKALVAQVADQHIVELDLHGIVAELNALAAGTYAPAEAPAPPAAPPAEAPKAEPAKAEAPKADAPQTGTAQGAAPKAPAKPSAPETVRVSVDRLNSLMDLVGELVLSRNRLLQLVADGEAAQDGQDLLRDVSAATTQLDFITTELQGAVMRTRMIPIGRIFAKFPRLVRDLSREFGKQIDLVMVGEETELDKTLTEELADPLIHLIRNACDHGVEMPERRVAAGKPARGTITLAAAHEGDHILIQIIDDGGGIDPERIKAKAVEKGLLTDAEAAELTDAQTFDLIFRAGFSTAEQVSQVSGRGVGMDVVKTNITRLNGVIRIDSEQGKGTTFTLRLPLTLAIIQSLLVGAGAETFAVPLHAVVEVVSLEDAAVKTIQGREVMRHREGVIPLLRVGEALHVPGYARDPRHAYAVIVGLAHRRLGLVVDHLVSQKEIVIKPLGEYLRKPPAVAGSTILGDGRVVMIVDIAELVARETAKLHESQLRADRSAQPAR